MKKILIGLVMLAGLLAELDLLAADLVLPTTVPQSNDLDSIRLFQRLTMSASGAWNAITGKGTNRIRVDIISGSSTETNVSAMIAGQTSRIDVNATNASSTETITQTNIYNRLGNLISTNAASLDAVSNRVVSLEGKIDTLTTKQDLLLGYYTNGVPLNSTNLVSVQGNVGYTNTLAPLTNAPTDSLYVISSGTNNIGGTLPAFAATPEVKGWPMYEALLTVTNLVDADGIVAGDALITNGIPVTGFTNALILGITYISSTNLSTVQAIDLLLTTNALDWVEAAAAAEIDDDEIDYPFSEYRFGTNSTADGKEWSVYGTKQLCTVTGKNEVTPSNINTLYVYLKTRAAITNAANDRIRIRWQNSY